MIGLWKRCVLGKFIESHRGCSAMKHSRGPQTSPPGSPPPEHPAQTGQTKAQASSARHYAFLKDQTRWCSKTRRLLIPAHLVLAPGRREELLSLLGPSVQDSLSAVVLERDPQVSITGVRTQDGMGDGINLKSAPGHDVDPAAYTNQAAAINAQKGYFTQPDTRQEVAADREQGGVRATGLRKRRAASMHVCSRGLC